MESPDIIESQGEPVRLVATLGRHQPAGWLATALGLIGCWLLVLLVVLATALRHRRLVAVCCRRIAAWCERHGRKRIIYDHADPGAPYLERYYLLWRDPSDAEQRAGIRPRKRPFNLVLHRFRRGDGDQALHDHPWWCWASLVLIGGYWEETPDGWRFRQPGTIALRSGKARHRVELDPRAGDEIWTLFGMGPRRSAWGFWSRDGRWFAHWEDWLDESAPVLMRQAMDAGRKGGAA